MSINNNRSNLQRFKKTRARFIGILLGLLSASTLTQAIAQPSQSNASSDLGRFFIEQPDTSKYAVILTGPSVGDETVDRFRQWSFSLHDILIRDYGYSSDTITLLLDRGKDSHPDNSRIDGACDRNTIVAQMAELRERVNRGDQITIFLIGHGTGRDDESKFNIVGPDITGDEFAAVLDEFDQQDIVIVNTTSASYGFSALLSSEGRVVISATRSPAERFDPIFPVILSKLLNSVMEIATRITEYPCLKHLTMPGKASISGMKTRVAWLRNMPAWMITGMHCSLSIQQRQKLTEDWQKLFISMC